LRFGKLFLKKGEKEYEAAAFGKYPEAPPADFYENY
jgi:hypothetical protein